MKRYDYIQGIEQLFADLKECARKVNCGDEPYSYFENKRVEFVAWVDKAKSTDWFIMPKRGRIFNMYNNIISTNETSN